MTFLTINAKTLANFRNLQNVSYYGRYCHGYEILEYFFLKGCDIILVCVFRLHYLCFQYSWQNKSFDHVFKSEIGK